MILTFYASKQNNDNAYKLDHVFAALSDSHLLAWMWGTHPAAHDGWMNKTTKTFIDCKYTN